MAKRAQMTGPTIALIYVRVSTRDQAENGVSLEMQIEQCRAHAQRKNWEVLEVFTDSTSGKEDENKRPGLAEMLKRTRELQNQKKNVVTVIYAVSRFVRRQSTLWRLLDDKNGEGLGISSATEDFDNTTPMGRAMLGMISTFATLEADLVSQRTRDALAFVKSQGKVLGQRPSTVLAPETVKIVQELSKSGLSQRKIAVELNRRGIPTPRGKAQWGLDAVQRCLDPAKYAK